jgi:hypothetical protein
MAKQIQSEPSLSLDRRQLLATAAAVTVAGVVPNAQTTQAVNSARAVNAAELPVPAWNVCAATSRRIEEIAERNRIREQARLPLLSVPKELRKMKKAADAAEFDKFADRHRQAVWDEVLGPVREARGEPNWCPTRLMEGLAFQAQVSRILRERFRCRSSGFTLKSYHSPC